MSKNKKYETCDGNYYDILHKVAEFYKVNAEDVSQQSIVKGRKIESLPICELWKAARNEKYRQRRLSPCPWKLPWHQSNSDYRRVYPYKPPC